MNVGSQLLFKNGYLQISSNQELYLLYAKSRKWVTCVEFIDAKNARKAVIYQFCREKFERGIGKEISLVDHDHHDHDCDDEKDKLPPWLKPIEGLNIHSFELERMNAKKSNLECALDRECIIYPLLDCLDDIFEEENPSGKIAQLVREKMPGKHATRIRLWLCSYLVFGRKPAALYPSYCNAGHYSRDACEDDVSFGRSVKKDGRRACRVTEEMKERIVEGYLKFADTGISEKKIYYKTLREYFKCRVLGKGRDRKVISPNGDPYPTINQFRYWVRKKIKPEMLREAKYGATRLRHTYEPDYGRFSQGVGNLLEVTEADGSNLGEQLIDFDGQPFADGFCIVSVADCATGAIFGVGFAPGAETLSAYRMALFSAAVPKSYFGKLFGVPLDDEQWPCRGISGQLDIDRGPGGSDKLLEEKVKIPFVELTGSYQPRSKATVESSHERSVKIEGEPLFFQSQYTPVDVVKRLILNANKNNWESDASGRLTPEMIRDGVLPNPISMWSWLDQRARTCALEITIDEAVKAFATPVEFTVSRDWIMLGARRFDAPGLRDELRSRIASGQTVKVRGYAIDMCVRYAWIEVNNRLVEMEALLPIRSGHQQLYVRLGYLQKEKAMLDQLKREQKEFNVAVNLDYYQACEETIGKAPDAGRWVKGRKKRSANLKAAAKVTKDATMPARAGK